jgi:hypothetical protein
MWIKCPVLGCSSSVGINEIPHHENIDKAILRLQKHLWERHTLDEIKEVVGRFLAEYMLKEEKEVEEK